MIVHTSIPPQNGDRLSAGPQADLIRLYATPGERFPSVAAMREWLMEKGVDCRAADSGKGLLKLFEKTEKDEARLVYDAGNERVLRCARAARIDVDVTIHGEQYPLVELCQIFLKRKIEAADLHVRAPEDISRVLSSLEIRSAHVRNSQQLWETLTSSEDAGQGIRRGLMEELGMGAAEVRLARISMGAACLDYEEPIDWPGIPSVLETQPAAAVLPEEISRPVYAELEAGDQLSIFVATPNAPVLKALLGMIIPRIQYVP